MEKKFVIATVVLAVIGLLCTATFADEGWLDSFDDALKQAGSEKKLVLVDFTATWCGWCTKLKEEVFEKDEFKQYVADKFVLVAIDADKNRELVDKYGVNGFPTIMVLDEAGKEVHKIVGFKPLEEFIEELKTVQPAK